MPKYENFNSLIWGIHPVEEALEERKSFNKVLINKELKSEALDKIAATCRQLHIPVQRVPAQKLNSLTRKNHQGIIGLMSPVTFYKTDQIIPILYESGRTPLILVLDGITDMRNFGAIIRSAAAFDVDAIVIAEIGGAPVTADTIKTSAGAIFKVKICKERNLKGTVKFLQDSGLQVVAATEKAKQSLTSIDFDRPTAIIMGAEDTGVSPALLQAVDEIVRIPIAKGVDSLNVSVATAVVLYEARRLH